jgi:hypothetical protein
MQLTFNNPFHSPIENIFLLTLHIKHSIKCETFYQFSPRLQDLWTDHLSQVQLVYQLVPEGVDEKAHQATPQISYTQ